jgi:hypothetical protein
MYLLIHMLRSFRLLPQSGFPTVALCLASIAGLAPSAFGQNCVGTPLNPLCIFQNYFVTGDYVVAGWVKGAPDGSGFAPGTISIPDTLQPAQNGVPAIVPRGADIVAAYLYWATVEGNQSSMAGLHAYFNGYAITADHGTPLGNPNAPTSWSAGGCSGNSQGSKTMRTYRADVHPYLPVDTNPASPTFGATVVNTALTNGPIQVRLADSGSNGNAAPIALGATLVIVYRVLSPAVPLNAIVLYDGAFAPSNAGQNVSQNLVGFYQPATNAVAKLTHIVANGQPNKGEQVTWTSSSQQMVPQPLPSLYGSLPPFPGKYGSWDNPTWPLSNLQTTDGSLTTSVMPTATNSGCVSWGAMILSTTVQDTDGDGLLDVWEQQQPGGSEPGYTDAVSGQWVPLPGANPDRKDIFVELHYLDDSDGSVAGVRLHTHLPKQAALDAVGDAFKNQNIHVHFDLGPGIYTNDPYVISTDAVSHSISEGQLVCTDPPNVAQCPYPSPPPGQPAIGWKGEFESIKDSQFQPGREKSYHYMLFGHALGAPRSYWSTLVSALAAKSALVGASIPQLVSIAVTAGTATITIQSPTLQSSGGVITPWDCFHNPPFPSGCSDQNGIIPRVNITGALSQTLLNGTYSFDPDKVTESRVNNVAKTIFTVTTSGVADGTYTFANEPQLAVTYLGPTSSSGHSDFRGGGDSMVTLGLWGSDDPAINGVGTVDEQTGTLMHELGHTLALTHGGTYYEDQNNPSVPTDELNCKPNYLSVMNYLFQVRGFVDGGFDYSGQTFAKLYKQSPPLSESVGIGAAIEDSATAAHLTRWYSKPNSLDDQLQKTTGSRYASAHCDGTPLLPGEAPAVRVDGTVAPGGTFSAPLDWNNDFVPGDAVAPPGEDLNHDGDLNQNGIIPDPPFRGLNDWQALKPKQNAPVVSQAVNLQQIDARSSPFGASGGVLSKGGGVLSKGGGIDDDGGGVLSKGGGVLSKGGGVLSKGGGIDQDEDTATSSADPSSGLTCTVPIGSVPGCVVSSGTQLENGKKVPLTWTAPGFGQTRSYTVWRATGSFTLQQILSSPGSFSVLTTLTGQPPATSYTDASVKNGATYTYFVTDANKQGAQSGPSNALVVTVKF